MNVAIAIGIFVTLVVGLVGWTIQRAVVRWRQGARAKADSVQQLVAQGFAPHIAQEQIAQAEAERKAAARAAGLKMAAIGLVLFVAGAVITGGTYALAQPGGYYYVSNGLFVGGLIAFARGLSQVLIGR